MNTHTLDDYDSDQLGKLDSMGYNYEMEILNELKPLQKELGFKITYHNPTDPKHWKRTKEQGIDFKLEVPTRDGIVYNIHIEASYQSHDYYYRKFWFIECRVPRFRFVPNSRFDIKTVVTNRPHNMLGVRPIAKKFGIRHIVNLTALTNLITRIHNLNFYHLLHNHYKDNVNKSNTKSNTNNVYACPKTELSSEDKAILEELSKPVRPIWLDWLRYELDMKED